MIWIWVLGVFLGELFFLAPPFLCLLLTLSSQMQPLQPKNQPFFPCYLFSKNFFSKIFSFFSGTIWQLAMYFYFRAPIPQIVLELRVRRLCFRIIFYINKTFIIFTPDWSDKRKERNGRIVFLSIGISVLPGKPNGSSTGVSGHDTSLYQSRKNSNCAEY